MRMNSKIECGWIANSNARWACRLECGWIAYNSRIMRMNSRLPHFRHKIPLDHAAVEVIRWFSSNRKVAVPVVVNYFMVVLLFVFVYRLFVPARLICYCYYLFRWQFMSCCASNWMRVSRPRGGGDVAKWRGGMLASRCPTLPFLYRTLWPRFADVVWFLSPFYRLRM